MKRRTLLKTSLGLTVLSLGGVGAYQAYRQSFDKTQTSPDASLKFLQQQDVILLQAITPIFLAEQLEHTKVSLQSVMSNLDAAIIRLPLSTQDELRELFDLLSNMLGRLVVAGVWLNWRHASADSLQQFLVDWRNSQLELLQVAYKGLHKLIIGSYYSESASWVALGYPGPPAINLGAQ